jgi:hypothetical protein
VFFKPQKGLGGRFESAPFSEGELGLPLLDDALVALNVNWLARSSMVTTLFSWVR